MKELVFDGPKAAARFARLYEAVIIGGMLPNQKRGIEIYRREAKILDALDTVSEAVDGKPIAMNAPSRALHTNGGTVSLDVGDLNLLLDRLKLEDVWHSAVSRELVDAVDWLTTVRDRAD
jgi:hypothetical protein